MSVCLFVRQLGRKHSLSFVFLRLLNICFMPYYVRLSINNYLVVAVFNALGK